VHKVSIAHQPRRSDKDCLMREYKPVLAIGKQSGAILATVNEAGMPSAGRGDNADEIRGLKFRKI
jgi:hypothetical protein